MQAEKAERWRQLCEQAAVEQDARKLLALINEINRLLSEKEDRLLRQTQGQKNQDAAA